MGVTTVHKPIMQVGNYMSFPVITGEPKMTLANAAIVMGLNKIGNLVIMKGNTADGRVEGVLTEREILDLVARKKSIRDIAVKDVLVQKYEAIPEQTRIAQAAKIMIRKGRRLFVYGRKRSGLDKLSGIITASDLMYAFQQTDRNPPIETVMSKRLVRVSPENTILHAVKVMVKERIGSVVVGEFENPIAIFSERDMMARVLAAGVSVEEKIMKYSSQPLIIANVGIGASDAAKVMLENNIKRLPLERDGRLEGIVTARDVVEAFQRRL